MQRSVRLDPSDIDPLAALMQAEEKKMHLEEEEAAKIGALTQPRTLADIFLSECR